MIKVGTIVLLIDAVQYALAGDFTLNPGVPKREEVIGPDGSVAYKTTFQAAVLEGNVRDTDGLDVKKLLALDDVTLTAELANGKSWVLAHAVNTSDGAMNIAEGEIAVRFAAQSAEEMR